MHVICFIYFNLLLFTSNKGTQVCCPVTYENKLYPKIELKGRRALCEPALNYNMIRTRDNWPADNDLECDGFLSDFTSSFGYYNNMADIEQTTGNDYNLHYAKIFQSEAATTNKSVRVMCTLGMKNRH